MYVLIFLLRSLLHFLRWMCFTGLCLVFARYDNIHIYECKYPSWWGTLKVTFIPILELCIYTLFRFQFMYISRNFLLCFNYFRFFLCWYIQNIAIHTVVSTCNSLRTCLLEGRNLAKSRGSQRWSTMKSKKRGFLSKKYVAILSVL